ncbi:MAG: hypothetical protein ACFFDN_38415 [Candidatus Hodarchaeota archaeon]
MNRNCFFASLGAILFSILSIVLVSSGAFTIPADEYDYSQIAYFIFISLGIILTGFGFREIYKEEEIKFSSLIFYIALISAIFLIVFHAIIMPIFISIESLERGTSYLVVGGICYAIFSTFFITNGIFFILKREDLGKERLNLISGILSLIFGSLFLITVNLLMANYMSQIDLVTLDKILEGLLILILIFDPEPENVLVLLILLDNAQNTLKSLSNTIAGLEIVVKYVAFLPLGISGFFTAINLFVLAKSDIS